MFDLIVVGAGPAGITAAVYAARKRLDFLIVTRDIGGQAALSADVENYTGYQFITGTELVAKFEEHLRQFSVAVRLDEPAQRVVCGKAGFVVETAKGRYEARAVVVASGRRPRLLGAKGEEVFRNRGVTYCATCDGPLFARKTVAVIGGGNSALDATLQMTRIAEKIYLVNVNPALGGEAVMREKVEASDKVEIYNGAATREIYGEKFVSGIKIEQGGVLKDLGVEGVFVEIGSTPNSEIAEGVDKNKNGEIIVDHLNRTNIPGLFAAGDVTDVPEKQIIVAAGEGAKALLGVSRYLSNLKT